MVKFLSALFFVFGFLSISFAQKKVETPKLVVGIVIDQMCYEYLYRFESKFSKNGFKKLMNNGTHCRNTQYNYVPTFTGPGHASIYTGTTPNNHGIIGNEWFDRNTGETVNCVFDSTAFGIGTESQNGKCSPHYLKANTITDQLRMTYPSSKVISMSIKDRGAILPGGHLSNGSFWFDNIAGKFVTSSYYKKELPFWVNTFNEKNYPTNYLNQTWNTLLPIEEYKESEPDNSTYEQLLQGKSTPTFPYDLKEMCKGQPNFNLFTSTPFANTYLTDFAVESIYNEMLGQDGQTDFLCISYSTPDIVGHAFGPYSVEMEDLYIRLDLEIARLIKELETRVGKNQFTLFLTADHAVVPVPQYLLDKKLPGGYLFLENNLIKLDEEVKSEFGADLILAEENNNIYLDHETIDFLKINRREVELFIAKIISNWEGVKNVYTSEELINSSLDNGWKDMIRLGYVPNASGDVVFMLEPGYLPKSKDSEKSRKGTSHGSAFNYDTHVPLIWYGKGIAKKEVFRRVNITDITATLVHLLNVQKPNATTGEPILEILEK
jgi:predicted AlkP superfamily pyrophosphatase or phosphodiesterase